MFVVPEVADIAPNITHRPVLLDGMGYLDDDDRVRDGEDNSRVADEMRGMSVEEIRNIIS